MELEVRKEGKLIDTFRGLVRNQSQSMDLDELKSMLVEQVKACFNKLIAQHKEVLTFSEVLDYTGLSESKLYKLTSLGEIPFFKPTGGKLFFKRDDLIEWLLCTRINDSVDRESEKILSRIRKP